HTCHPCGRVRTPFGGHCETMIAGEERARHAFSTYHVAFVWEIQPRSRQRTAVRSRRRAITAAPSGEGRPLGTAAEQTVVCTAPIAAHVHDEKCRSERNPGY